MPLRPAALALLLAFTAFSCRRSRTKLDQVPRLAYGAKPAVVRINAVATAQFHYPAEAVEAVADGLGFDTRNLRAGSDVVDTGAGGSGSGFIIRSDGYILTSGHVVAATRDEAALGRELRRNGAIGALVKHFPVEQLRARQKDGTLEPFIAAFARAGVIDKVHVINQVELSDGETLTFTVTSYSPALTEKGTDLALLHVDHRDLPALPLGDSDDIRVGDPIWTVGYPAIASSTDEVIGGWLSRESDLEATFNAGTITAIRRDIAKHEVLQSNVAIYHGNSGGPAVDRDGKVVGVAAWGPVAAEQIKFLVPVGVVKAFIHDTGVLPAVDGEFNLHYRAALDAAGSGNWRAARVDLDKASQIFPNSPDLARFHADVERVVRSSTWYQLHPAGASMLGLVVLGVLGIAGVLAVRNSHMRQLSPSGASGKFATVLPDARDAAKGAAPRLLGRFTILNGSRAGERLGLGGTGIRIGREQSICEIVLENPKISRLHAEVVCMDGKVLLIDRNSANGTFVNDHKIDRQFLRNGDIIYFGGRNAVAVAFHV